MKGTYLHKQLNFIRQISIINTIFFIFSINSFAQTSLYFENATTGYPKTYTFSSGDVLTLSSGKNTSTSNVCPGYNGATRSYRIQESVFVLQLVSTTLDSLVLFGSGTSSSGRNISKIEISTISKDGPYTDITNSVKIGAPKASTSCTGNLSVGNINAQIGTFVKLTITLFSDKTTLAALNTSEFLIFPISIWNSTWNTTPDINKNVILRANYNGNGFLCRNLTIEPGIQTTITSGLLSINNNLTLECNEIHGAATIIENGGTINVNGTSNIQQYLSSGRNWYISSPVSGATSAVFNPSGGYNNLYRYDETHGSTAPWVQISDNITNLDIMKGYVFNTGSSGKYTFSGNLNTGDKSITIYRTAGQVKEGFNLVGNPYSSYYNWADVIRNNVLSTMWFRTKNMDDNYIFATVNSAYETPEIISNNASTTVSNWIPPMQAFWVRVNPEQTTGSISFSNSLRNHKDILGNSLKIKTVNKATHQSIKLSVSNSINSDETILAFTPNASNGYDDYDSPKISNNNPDIPEIFTISDNEILAINGLNNIEDNQSTALGFKTDVYGTFTIKATEIKNFDADTQLFLNDVLTNRNCNLTDGNIYSFTSDTTNSTDRFRLEFRSPSISTNIIQSNAVDNLKLNIYKYADNQIKVCYKDYTDAAVVSIQNILGKILFYSRITNPITIVDTKLNFGIYIVTVTDMGRSISKKIAIK